MSDHIPANANQTKAKIIIVDDHPIVRQGLAQVLNVQADMHLCCEASNAEEAMLAMENCHHDLAIVDISLEGTSGFTLITSIVTHFPGLPILVMSMHEESINAERSLKLGARGYIMKHRATIDLKIAIRQILAGELYVSDEIHRMILDRMSSNSSELGKDDPTKILTIREFEILRLIGFGFGTRAISEQLNRSVKTIEAHRANIKQKLGLCTGIELLRFATLWVKKNEKSPDE